MILFDPALDMAFANYGIMVPILDSRASRTVDFLQTAGPLSAAGPVCDVAGALRLLGLSPAGPLITRDDLARVHQKDFVDAFYEAGPEGPKGLEKILLHAYELLDVHGECCGYEPDKAVKPLNDLAKTVLAQAGAAYLACRLAHAGGTGTPAGFCYYLGGGMHHARYDSGSGYCLINDVVISARKLQAEGLAKLIWVIDVDAHKGDGTAELVHLARLRGGPDILNLSVHMASGWPLDEATRKAAAPGRAPLVPADVEIPIDEGAEDSYVPKLAQGLRTLEGLSGALRPDLAIVVDGADPYEHDGLPSSAPLRLTLEQCVLRDRCIYDFLQDRHIPSAWVMAGGYGDRAWEPPAHFLASLT
jgi:acetoin utilization deacetylase AcuC-like enzyme